MLLLVLILVVIAFGLLVVALLSGSVLWAWVSVGVSVVAAVVLLVDWLQRRAAVKAGAAPAVETVQGAPAPLASPPMGFQPALGRPPLADMDPATEVLPVVPSSSRGADETVAAPAPEQSGPRPSDAQQTVVMPAVQPSGSPARPSGADPALTSSGANSSPTVTNEDGDRSDPGFGSGDATSSTAAAAGLAAGAAAAGAVAERKADDPADEKAPSLQKSPSLTKDEAPADERVGTAEKGADGAPEAAVPGSDAAAPEPAGAEAAGSVAGPATSASSSPASSSPASSTSGPDAESTVKVEAHTRAPAEPAGSAPASAAEDVDLFGAPPVRRPVEQAPPSQTPAAQTPAAQTPPAQNPPSQTPAAQNPPVQTPPADPAPSVEEAPEEPRDPVAAELVGTLEDEVVVVDEQPRYHLPECRALVAVAVIPLPVREAVELGFTPCGWCSPDRTLAGRHQTASR